MVSIDLEGLDKVNTVAVRLETASGRVGAAGGRAVRKAAAFVETNAKAIAPVDTGELVSKIGPPVFHGDGRSGEAGADITSHADHSVYVEVGTDRMAPQAFMGPSADRAAPLLTAAIAAVSDPFDGPRS